MIACSRILFLLLLFGLHLSLAACSGVTGFLSNSVAPGLSAGQVQSSLVEESANGLISIARPIPPLSVDIEPRLLAFSPVEEGGQVWIEIEGGRRRLHLMEGTTKVHSTELQGEMLLVPGAYQVVHKQRSAPWYASDEYFSKRGMPVPPPADKARFLRGALGDYALFVDLDTPIHCGPVWTAEVGGLLLEEQDCAKLYYQVPVGALVRVK